ncbi:MAG: hypothetical protein CL605_01760 [Altibacter sp.]|nr:hypothetical protein [Altibacter sp.]
MVFLELIISKDEINTEELRRKLEELEEAKRIKDEKEESLRAVANKDPNEVMMSWLQYQCHDEMQVIKDISNNLKINFTDAKQYISKMPEELMIEEKTIPDVVKELRYMRRTLKGKTREKMASTINHLIKAYSEHLDNSLDSIYWLRPFKKSVRMLTPDIKMMKKFHHIKDGETRQVIIDNLVKMWEANLQKSSLEYGEEYNTAIIKFKSSKKNIKSILKEISHQSIRKPRQEVLEDMLVKTICDNPGITSNTIHSLLPSSYHRSTTPQTISKMLKRVQAINVGGEYYILSDAIRKDLYSYVAGFIDSDGYITMDSKYAPRVGMIATGDRGKAFFKEMENQLKIGRLHLDQKVGENNRSQHRLNFYSQGDISKLLDKTIPHLRMKKEQGKLIQEAIMIKQNFSKEDWAKPRLEEIFKLIKWENWKDAANKVELQKYNIQEEDIIKYRENSRWAYMNAVDTISKEE